MQSISLVSLWITRTTQCPVKKAQTKQAQHVRGPESDDLSFSEFVPICDDCGHSVYLQAAARDFPCQGVSVQNSVGKMENLIRK